MKKKTIFCGFGAPFWSPKVLKSIAKNQVVCTSWVTPKKRDFFFWMKSLRKYKCLKTIVFTTFFEGFSMYKYSKMQFPCDVHIENGAPMRTPNAPKCRHCSQKLNGKKHMPSDAGFWTNFHDFWAHLGLIIDCFLMRIRKAEEVQKPLFLLWFCKVLASRNRPKYPPK